MTDARTPLERWDDLIEQLIGILPAEEYSPSLRIKEKWADMIDEAFEAKILLQRLAHEKKRRRNGFET